MSFFESLRDDPRMRWVVRGVVILVVIGLGWGGWVLWKSRYEAQGALALAQGRVLTAQALAQGAPPEVRQRAEKALEEVIRDYPRLSSVSQAAYLLGSLRFGTGRYAEARSSFELARSKASSPTVGALAALDVAYCWEAEKNYAEAEKAYLSAISGTKPKDFLYEEILFDLARVQELGGNKAAAVETYQRLLKDLPDSRRAEELRSRLASLQAPATKP